MFYACRWLLPIDRPPIEHAWLETAHGVIRRLGEGPPPAPAENLGDVVVMPGLVNAHTHLELSWMAGQVAPAASLVAWIRAMLTLRRSGAPGGQAREAQAVGEALASMHASGTVLVGDISNSLMTPALMARAGMGGVVFHELIGFDVIDPVSVVSDAIGRLGIVHGQIDRAVPLVRLSLAAHAPYSVAPSLFREIAARVPDGPLSVHLAESADELAFLRTGRGPMRDLLDDLGSWTPAWSAPGGGPVEYLAQQGYLRRGLLAVHGVHLADDDLWRLREAGATLVTCPRSNLWVGAGMPRIPHFYAAGLPVAIGTDSLASVDSLSLFDELAELRRIAPDVTAAALLASATRVGAEALGFGQTHGTIAAGKTAALLAVDIPARVRDVEEYLVSGVPSSAVHHLS